MVERIVQNPDKPIVNPYDLGPEAVITPSPDKLANAQRDIGRRLVN